jgi:high-affinity iron transporter
MASEIAKLLTQADLLTLFTKPLWEKIELIDMSSVTGILLHVLIGYEPQPSGLQLIFYMSTILVIGLGMKLSKPSIIKK